MVSAPAKLGDLTRQSKGDGVVATTRKWFIRNIAEVAWHQFPDHFGGALSKPLVMPETAGSHHCSAATVLANPRF